MLSLEDELPAPLADAPRHCAGCRAKLAAGNVTDNPSEVGVVKNVEELPSEHEGHSFVDGDGLRCSEIGIDDARSVEEADRGIAQLPYRLGGKRTRLEVSVRSVQAGVARILSHHRAGYKRNIQADSRQGVIVTLAERNGKTGREPADSADGPTLCQALRQGAKRAVERNFPRVAGNEIMRKVEWRKNTTEGKVGRIQRPVVIVDGFGIGVRDQERYVACSALRGNLQGIVIRISDVGQPCGRPVNNGVIGLAECLIVQGAEAESRVSNGQKCAAYLAAIGKREG